MLGWMESTMIAVWVRESLYGWAIMLTAHALGTATVIGIVAVTGMRLLGLFRPIPYTTLYKWLGVAWIGVVVNIISGTSLFLSNASSYVVDISFLLKMTFIISGIVVIWYLQKTIKREGTNWDSSGAVSAAGHKIAMGLLGLWTLAIILGRLVAYI